MNDRATTKIAFYGIFSALVFVVMFLETYVFTILIPLAPPAFLSLSLAVTLSVFGDWRNMFFGGTVFGMCSLIIAFIIGNPVFILPWISILPRIFIGVVSFGMLKFVKMFTNKSKVKFIRKTLPYSICAIFGIITNTVLVLLVMFLSKFIGIEEVVGTFMAINFPIEIIATMILVPIFVNAIRKYKHLGE